MVKRKFDEDSDFCIQQQYRMQRPSKKKSETTIFDPKTQKNSGKWNLEQKKLYVQFLQNHAEQIIDENYRKQMKVFKQISLSVKTRTPDQCRSHHQKILKIHKSVDNILRVYQQRGLIKSLISQMKQEKTTEGLIFQKEEKLTCHINSLQYFSCKMVGKNLSIVIDDTRIQNF